MGGPLSCILADVFMENYEDMIHFQIDGNPIDLDWLRYRDDTFMEWLFSMDQLYDFWHNLNSIHSAIQWDKPVVEVNGVIILLDVLMKKSGGSFITSVYRKSTHTGKCLHFSLNHPFTQSMAGVST